MSTEKVLGKIDQVFFGFGGYQDAQIGLWLVLSLSGGSAVHAGIEGGWAIWIKHTERTEWTEEDRSKGYAYMVREIQEVMRKAKVQDITQLRGVPIEATIGDRALVSWRVLEEVL